MRYAGGEESYWVEYCLAAIGVLVGLVRYWDGEEGGEGETNSPR